MTLNTTDSKIVYAGDGSTTVFAIPFKFLANADKLDRHSTYPLNGESGSTPGVPIHLGHDESGQAYSGMKLFGHAHCVLTGHSINYQQDLTRLHLRFYLGQFFHHLFVDM